MRNIEIKNIEEKIVHVYCDECKREIIQRYGSKHCQYCVKDLCLSCSSYDDGNDSCRIWCDNCWNVIGKKYRDEIEILENKIEKLKEEWINVCSKEKF